MREELGGIRARGTEQAGNPKVTFDEVVTECALQLDLVPALARTLTSCVALSKTPTQFIRKEIKTQNGCNEVFPSCGLLEG